MPAKAPKIDEVPAAPEHDLGELQEEFTFSRRRLLFRAAVVLVVTGFMPLLFHLAYPAAFAPISRFDQVMAVGCIGTTLALLSSGLGLLWHYYQRRHFRVLLFEQGLVAERLADVFLCRWDEVQWTQEILDEPRDNLNHESKTLRGLTVHCHDGREWTFQRMAECLQGSQRLIAAIQERVAATMLPQALADIYKGRHLECGTVQLTFLGITTPNQMFPWTELKGVSGHGLGIKIRRRGLFGESKRIDARHLVNKHLVLALAKAMCQGRR
jgi:hypothetical protein